MGMPITVEVVDPGVTEADIANVFAYFRTVDETFSTYKEHSEISKINRGELRADEYSDDMKTIFALSEQTRQETQGYFDIRHNGVTDPSGIVKGWAILQAATMLKAAGFMHFYIDAGGDIQVAGNKGGNAWRIGIRNPFNRNEIVKVLSITDKGIATSGTAIRGQHIYDPHNPPRERPHPHNPHRGRPLAPIHTANAASATLKCEPETPLRATASQSSGSIRSASASHSSSVKGERSPPHFHTSPAPTDIVRQHITDIVSLTVVGPNVYEADRFATAAFAMGKKGIYFIEQLPGFEGYMIDASARATFTSGFERYVLQHDNTH